MASYEMIFKNNSTSAYHFGVYQHYPSSPGLKSVVWQVRRLGPGATSKVSWKLQYGVAITDWDINEGSFSAGEQIVNAQLGNAYAISMLDGDVPSIDPKPCSSNQIRIPDGQIRLHNNTKRAFNMGFAVGGAVIAVAPSRGNQWASFEVHPTYYVALYQHVTIGSLVDSCIVLAPVEVTFPDGTTKAVVECRNVGAQEELKASIIE